jgi:hypothetical protein
MPIMRTEGTMLGGEAENAVVWSSTVGTAHADVLPPHQLPYDQQYQRTTERDLIADAYVLGPVNQSCRTVYVCMPLVPAL